VLILLDLFHFIYQNLLHTNPPLIISEEQLRDSFKIIDEGLTLVDKSMGRE
jgi:hypothetical protein